MKLLIKYPTRGRPRKSVETLRKYIDLADDMSQIKILVSIDEDDTSVSESMFMIHPSIDIVRGPSLGKIGAINRDIPDPSTFDILLLASDDMIPHAKGYDTIIRSRMLQHFPDTDGVLWFNDGYTRFRLNTLVICGSKYYQRFGYIYYPEYKSLWCDNEFMDVANKLGRQIYFDDVIIRHEHPANNRTIFRDRLYLKNETFNNTDRALYESRMTKTYDLSILICTIDSRFQLLTSLINHINKLKQTSSLSVEVLYDNTPSISVGEKRNRLVSRCRGTYCCFIDDDDKITDDYLSVIEDSKLTYDCIALNGMMYVDGKEYRPFYHSIEYDKWVDTVSAYYRMPNHLNPMKTDIMREIVFPNASYHEDRDFSKRLQESGRIQTEYKHTRLQYLYMFSKSQSATWGKQSSSILSRILKGKRK